MTQSAEDEIIATFDYWSICDGKPNMDRELVRYRASQLAKLVADSDQLIADIKALDKNTE